MSKLKAAILKINKEYKEEMGVVGIGRSEVPRIPFTSAKLNYASYGGVPVGRAIEFYGEEQSGKTTAAIDIASNAQKIFHKELLDRKSALTSIIKGAKSTKVQKDKAQEELGSLCARSVVFFDCENTYDPIWAEKLGVDNSSLVLFRPTDQSADQIFDMIEDIVETGEAGLVILDSIGALCSSLEMEKANGEKTYGGIASELTRFSKKIVGRLKRHSTTFIGINQVREDLSNPFEQYKTPGGKSWKHNCTMRIGFSEGKFIDANGEELKKALEGVGKNLKIIMKKNKVSPQDRKNGGFLIHFKQGVYKELDLIELAMTLGYIEQSGSWFQFVDDNGEYVKDSGGDIKLQGKIKVIKYLKQNPDIYNLLESIIQKEIVGESAGDCKGKN